MYRVTLGEIHLRHCGPFLHRAHVAALAVRAPAEQQDSGSHKLQTEASRLTLQLSKDPKKSKTVQLVEVTEKLWKSEKYQKKAHEAIKSFPMFSRQLLRQMVDPLDAERN